MTDEKDLIRERKKKLENISEFSLTYPNKVIKSDTTRSLINTCSNEDKKSLEEKNILTNICGRVMTIREMGNSVFADLHDEYGKIQIYLNKKNLDEISQKMFKNLDLGDIVGISGVIFKTKTQELTINVDSFLILSKCLRPLPEKFHGIADIEIKYRQRYLDLMTNFETRVHFKKRSKIIKIIRNYFEERDYIEVETPMMHIIPGGANAKPFITHHNSLDMDLFLRIAPELFLKRCIIGGYEKVFEINRSFRNEGLSIKHNPEFTMLEAYWAYADFEAMADLVEEMVCSVAEKYCGGLNIETKDEDGNVTKNINLSRPWKRAPYKELIKDVAGQDWFEFTSDQRREKCAELGVEISEQMEDYEVTQQVFEKLVEEKTFDPLYVTHVPKELVPLAKQNTNDDSLVDVYELIINGQEISPGYSELNDPDIQRQRLMDQAGEETQKVDEEFLTALEHGMPPAGGIGIGIDRLVIMLTSAESIRDVVLFPQLKKSGDEENS